MEKQNTTKRCKKGERRVYFNDGTFQCLPINEEQAKRNKTRKEKLAKPIVEVENPTRCPKGQRKAFLNAEKTKWTCQEANEAQLKINHKKREKYLAENAAPAVVAVVAPAVVDVTPKVLLSKVPINAYDRIRVIPQRGIPEESDDDEEMLKSVVTETSDKIQEKWKERLVHIKGDPKITTVKEGIDKLHPDVSAPNFSQKIAQKREFAPHRYDANIYSVYSRAEQLCHLPISFHPYQMFIKHFLSPQTPYKSMLLYHGLGTGKTMTAIGVCEQMRHYMKHTGQIKPIYIISSQNISHNFKQALFDVSILPDDLSVLEPKNLPIYMTEILRELNPEMKFPNITKNQLKNRVLQLLKPYYEYMGYTKLGLVISSLLRFKNKSLDLSASKENIRRRFSNTMIVVDEVHNIRYHSKEKNKIQNRVGELLMLVAEHSQNMRLLLMSATPVFDSSSEIITIVNLLNVNDKRPTIDESQVFVSKGEKKGEFIEGKKGANVGKALLESKLKGYVSFVRGENPYSFPFRVYPHLFDRSHTLATVHQNAYEDEDSDHAPIPYPTQAFDQTAIADDQKLQITCLYVDPLSEYQQSVYEKLLEEDQNKKHAFSWGKLVQSLNIVFPGEQMGDEGFISTMQVVLRGQEETYSYKNRKEPIYSREKIGQYSAKIKNILSCIEKGEGISLVYSQFLYSGVISMALALEEAGYVRYERGALLTNGVGDVVTKGQYMLITGDNKMTPDSMKTMVSEANKNGEIIKVVLISEAGSEGIDFKNIRQVHIMEPWYNLNRMEQVIGRAIRYKSHCALPFRKRNVEIYLHTAYTGDIETIDAYIYRVYAEPKAIQMGQVNRLLKTIAVDLHLNIGQSNMTVEDLRTLSANTNVSIELSCGKEIVNYAIGDRPYTAVCDYADTCKYYKGEVLDSDKDTAETSTFHHHHLQSTYEILLQRIQELFRENPFLTRQEIVALINYGAHEYSLEEIYHVLKKILKPPYLMFRNRHGDWGYLIEQDGRFMFQPKTQDHENMTTSERLLAVEGKWVEPVRHAKLSLENEAAPLTTDVATDAATTTTTVAPTIIQVDKSRYDQLMKMWTKALAKLWKNGNGEKDEDKGENASQFEQWMQALNTRYTHNKESTTVLALYQMLFPEENQKSMEEILMHHFIESLDHSDKITLFHYCGNHAILVPYFQKHCSMKVGSEQVFVFYDLWNKENKQEKMRWHLFKQNKTEVTSLLERQEYMKTYKTFKQNNLILAETIGCLDVKTDKKNNEQSISLKLKTTGQSNNYNKGVFCNNEKKQMFIHLIASLKESDTSDLGNLTKVLRMVDEFRFLKIGLCVLTEMTLRTWNHRSTQKIYFLSPEAFHKSSLK